jgi:hypothetical protein
MVSSSNKCTKPNVPRWSGGVEGDFDTLMPDDGALVFHSCSRRAVVDGGRKWVIDEHPRKTISDPPALMDTEHAMTFRMSSACLSSQFHHPISYHVDIGHPTLWLMVTHYPLRIFESRCNATNCSSVLRSSRVTLPRA